MAKSVAEIAKVMAKAKADAHSDPKILELFTRNRYKAISSPPYNLDLADLVAAYDDPKLNPEPTDPWGHGRAGLVASDPWGGGRAGSVAPDQPDHGRAGIVKPKPTEM